MSRPNARCPRLLRVVLLPRDAVLQLLVFLCRFWQVLLSPLVGYRCRFYPTCSEYAVQSLRAHGLLRGGFFAARRICRCHPWGGSGVDPVPLPRGKHRIATKLEAGSMGVAGLGDESTKDLRT